MLKLCRVTKVKVLFLVLVYVFNFNLFEFSAAILEKNLLFLGLRVWCYIRQYPLFDDCLIVNGSLLQGLFYQTRLFASFFLWRVEASAGAWV